jgi:hypothetical protein
MLFLLIIIKVVMMAPHIPVIAITTTQTLSVVSGHAVRQAYSYST